MKKSSVLALALSVIVCVPLLSSANNRMYYDSRHCSERVRHGNAMVIYNPDGPLCKWHKHHYRHHHKHHCGKATASAHHHHHHKHHVKAKEAKPAAK